MSEVAVLEELQKKRTELENHWSSQLQKEKTLEGDIKALEEKVQAQLQEKIKVQGAALETLESKRKDLERRLKELQEQSASSQTLKEPIMEAAEANEEVQEQPAEMTMKAAANDNAQSQTEDTKEKHKEEKKRKWM